MGIFDKRKSISREQLRSTFKKDPGTIPGTGGKKYYQKEREKMFRGTFGPGYGSQISKEEYRRAIRELESARNRTKTRSERIKIDEQIRYFKGPRGKRI